MQSTSAEFASWVLAQLGVRSPGLTHRCDLERPLLREDCVCPCLATLTMTLFLTSVSHQQSLATSKSHDERNPPQLIFRKFFSLALSFPNSKIFYFILFFKKLSNPGHQDLGARLQRLLPRQGRERRRCFFQGPAQVVERRRVESGPAVVSFGVRGFQVRFGMFFGEFFPYTL